MSQLLELEGKVELDPTIDFIAGTVAGITGLVVGFPFDTIKVRFQNPATAIKYDSTMHAVTTIIREEKFIGLYKGISSPLASTAFLNGLIFASYNFFMKAQLDHNQAIPTLTQITLAGQSCLHPTSARHVALQIFRESGMRGLYRGLAVTALRDTGYGAYFFTYEATCRLLASPGSGLSSNKSASGTINLSWPSLLFAGGMAGIIGWLATFPFDVVKTRIQSSNVEASARIPLLGSLQPMHSVDTNPYRTILSTIVNSYRADGLGVFFRGLAPTLIR
ncbi:hypothetical protein H0H81_003927 [Sphagnurus paluster]|uniref:Uncharacterized protein n=1 Tax=Sphagnurus paluster TaxID=117069 RepID=A0A9P7GQF4_9AGAR|nr:hypothetical protein H0H81_003927 [Sphagnurus paluster]